MSFREAIDYGLVHEIRSALFPADADLSVINEDGSQGTIKKVPVGVVEQPQIVRHGTAPAIQSFTESAVLNHGTFFQ